MRDARGTSPTRGPRRSDQADDGRRSISRSAEHRRHQPAMASRSGNPVSLPGSGMTPKGTPEVTWSSPPPSRSAGDGWTRRGHRDPSQPEAGPGSAEEVERRSLRRRYDPGPACYSGPFRFGRIWPSSQFRPRLLPLPRTIPIRPRYLAAEIEVLTKPRAIADPHQPPGELEATDDQGRSLIKPDAAADGPRRRSTPTPSATPIPSSASRSALPAPRASGSRYSQAWCPSGSASSRSDFSTSIPLAGSTGRDVPCRRPPGDGRRSSPPGRADSQRCDSDTIEGGRGRERQVSRR